MRVLALASIELGLPPRGERGRGAHPRYPAGTLILNFADGYFEPSPDEQRASDEVLEDQEKQLGLRSE